MSGKMMSLKLLIDKSSNMVLFAEASNEVVDFLFGLLCIPLGTIIKLLTKERTVGSIANIYQSVERLDDTYLQTIQDKNLLLDPMVLLPTNRHRHPTLLLPGPSTTKTYYSCCDCVEPTIYFTDGTGVPCPSCKYRMIEEMYIQYVDFRSRKVEADHSSDGFVNGDMTYTIKDDLTITPILSAISSITLLNIFNIKDLDSLQERTVKLGLEEGLELLKFSLQSKTVLTDVFLRK